MLGTAPNKISFANKVVGVILIAFPMLTGAQETICCGLLENQKISRFVAYHLGLAL